MYQSSETGQPEFAERTNSADVQHAASAEISIDAHLLLKQMATEAHDPEQMIDQPGNNGTNVEIAEENLLITRTNFEENLPVFHSNSDDDSASLKQLEEKINSLSRELRLQQDETGRLKESLKILSDKENSLNFESKRSVRYWSELTDHVSDLEADAAKWKKIVVVGGITFCLIITILLFVVFSV